eukprot:scaffold186761_cov35-Tisochrysis_lutea.AAC.2
MSHSHGGTRSGLFSPCKGDVFHLYQWVSCCYTSCRLCASEGGKSLKHAGSYRLVLQQERLCSIWNGAATQACAVTYASVSTSTCPGTDEQSALGRSPRERSLACVYFQRYSVAHSHWVHPAAQ